MMMNILMAMTTITTLIRNKHRMNYYTLGLKKSLDFKGRTTRKEFWIFFVLHILVANTLENILYFSDIHIVAHIFFIFILWLPIISVSVRRMHDINRSGWWIIVPIVPLVFTFFKSKEDNEFGIKPEEQNVKNKSLFTIFIIAIIVAMGITGNMVRRDFRNTMQDYTDIRSMDFLSEERIRELERKYK